MSSGLYNEGLFREGLLRTTNLVRPGLITQFDTLEEALTRFAVNGVEAALALDFIASEYRTGNTATTFADAFTGNSPKLTYSTSAGSNSTMVNSEGKIVWAPHNLLDYSEDFSQWIGLNAPVTANATSAPDGTATADLVEFSAQYGHLRTSYSLTPGFRYTYKIWCRVEAGTRTFSVRDFNTGTEYGSFTATTEWDLYSVPFTADSNGSLMAIQDRSASGFVDTYIWGAHLYRSDLGGMHPVPGAATGFETYVPTNGNAEYLPRVGHHVYNGSTWVNEGLLIESEPRTNLVTHSEDFENSAWGKAGTTAIDSTLVTGPDGTLSGRRVLNFDDALGDRLIEQVSITNATLTGSVWVKGEGDNIGKDIRLTVKRDGGTFVVTNVSHTLTADWERIHATFTQLPDNTGAQIILNCPTANQASEVLIYGAQLEAGSTPSSYMPTYGGTYTRTAQSLTVPAHWYDVDNPTYTGPELVTNGDFSNGTTGWAGNNATLSLSSGRLRVTDNGSSAYAYQVLTVEPGKTYKLTFDYLFPSANTATDYEVNIRNTNQSGSILKGLNTGTTTWVEDVLSSNSMTFTPTTSTVGLTLASSSTTGDYADFDNISVRQVSAPQFGWPEPEYIGPELVTASSDLVPQFYPAEWTLGVGSASVTGISSNDRLWLFGVGNTNLLPAGTYNVSYTIGAGTDRLSGLYFDGAYISTSSTAGDKSVTFTTDGTRQSPFFFLNAGGNLYLTNISVREINPLSVSIQMDGRMTYADEGVGVAADGITSQVVPFTWLLGASDYIYTGLSTSSTATGVPVFVQEASGTVDSVSSASPGYTPGVNVPFNISSRHGSTFINGAVDGVALTEDTTPTALPDLSGTNLQIAYDFMGTIGTFRQFAGDIGDAGLVTATNPSTEPTLSLTFDGTGSSFYNLSWSE